jgi:hypothetical protein
MKTDSSRASVLTLLAALAGLVLGGAALWLGVQEDAIAFWGFGAASLLQVPPALSLRGRIKDGLGNSGLERDRLTLRIVSHLLRLLALGMAMASVSALLAGRAPRAGFLMPAFSTLAAGLQLSLWLGKRGLSGIHPILELGIVRTRTALELAALLVLGSFLGQWLPSADAITSLLLALRIFLEGRTLGKSTTLQAAACGGCGSGCGCG